MIKNLYIAYYSNSNISLRIFANKSSIIFVEFLKKTYKQKVTELNPALKKCLKELDEYFSGKRKKFSLELMFIGTPFQTSVWNAIYKIPFGKLKTYSEIAKEIGNPKAVRAVGSACGKNPIPVLIPCHRVIGKNNSLGGFGGGLKLKKYLLKNEGIEL